MAAPLHYTLKHPFTSAAGERIEQLPIQRLKRKDIAAAQKYSKDDAEIEDFMLARMTGLALEDLAELDIADSKAIADVFREMVGG